MTKESHNFARPTNAQHLLDGLHIGGIGKIKRLPSLKNSLTWLAYIVE